VTLVIVIYLSVFTLAKSVGKGALQVDLTKEVKCQDANKAAEGDKVTVHYGGFLQNGTKFDSSFDRAQPFTFTIGVGQVIPGWDQGLLDVCPGEERHLVVPAPLAYGDRGAGDVIPPGATLLFDIVIIGVEKVGNEQEEKDEIERKKQEEEEDRKKEEKKRKQEEEEDLKRLEAEERKLKEEKARKEEEEQRRKQQRLREEEEERRLAEIRAQEEEEKRQAAELKAKKEKQQRQREEQERRRIEKERAEAEEQRKLEEEIAEIEKEQKREEEKRRKEELNVRQESERRKEEEYDEEYYYYDYESTCEPGELKKKVTKRVPRCNLVSESGDQLTMHYTGKLEKTGRKFDSSVDRNKPFQFTLGVGQVIAGWDEGLVGMCVGEKRTLVIPPDLAYGEQGVGTVIPSCSTLVFDVELLDIVVS